MKLSIITISLNNASGLIKTIESVVSQNSREFEYIIIDGGSSDGSVKVIKSFTSIPPGIYNARDEEKNNVIIDAGTLALSPNRPIPQPTNRSPSPSDYALQFSPVTYWLSEPDSGIYNAMNKGIQVAKGEYCQFLNSGDWLAAKDVIEKILSTLPDCSIYYGNLLKKMSNGKILRNKEIPVNSLLTFYTGSFNQSSSFIKHSLFNKYGLFDESLKIASDWKFFLVTIVLNKEKVRYCNIDVSYFDMNGISNTNKDLDRIERGIVLEQIIPTNILADYDHYAKLILQMKRINRFKLTRWIVWFIERVLFKMEKWETRWKGEHILY